MHDTDHLYCFASIVLRAAKNTPVLFKNTSVMRIGLSGSIDYTILQYWLYDFAVELLSKNKSHAVFSISESLKNLAQGKGVSFQ